MEQVVLAHIGHHEDGTYTAECYNLPVVTQGRSLDEAARNLKEAVALALADGDYRLFGLPPIVVTLELSVQDAA